MTYFAGSRDEGYGETGSAHLLEHILFLQTKGGRNVKKELAEHGAVWNGSTSWDRTNYFEIITASDANVKWALQLEADRMSNMRIESALLTKELGVVRNEFAMGENTPSRILLQRVLETAFTAHAYGRLPIGYESDVGSVSMKRLTAFYDKFYQPDNALLLIAGNFDPPKALAWIGELFGANPRPQRILERPHTVESAQDGERSVTLRRVGNHQEIAVIYHVPAATHPDIEALNVLTTILGDSQSGRLYKALVESKKAIGASMLIQELHDPGFALAQIQLRSNQSLDDVRDITLGTIEGLVNDPPSAAEVEHAKTKLLKEFESDITNSLEIGSSITECAASGDWRLVFLKRDATHSVTASDVIRVATTYLRASNRTLGEFIPTQDPDRLEIPAAPDLGNLFKDFKPGLAISEGEALLPTPQEIERRLVRTRFASGPRLALLSKKAHSGAVVARIRLNFGNEKTLVGKSSVARLTAALLMEGAKTKTHQQIQNEMELLSAHISITGAATHLIADLETVDANLPKALRLVKEILSEPSLLPERLDLVKQQQIAALEFNSSEPDYLARTVLLGRLNRYSNGDVRSFPALKEQIDALRAVTIDDIRRFHKAFYGASDAQVAICGQVNAGDIEKVIAKLFGSWHSPSLYQSLPILYQKTEAANETIKTPGKQNAFFVAGMKIKMSDNDPDYPAMVIANLVFGGYSGRSRLANRLREKEGLTYSTGSTFVAPSEGDGATFTVAASSDPKSMPRVAAAFHGELKQALKSGFTDEEVKEAKQWWRDQQMTLRSQTNTLIELLTEHERLGRTMKWDEQLEQRVAALTAKEVSIAFQRHIVESQLVQVQAGDFGDLGGR